MYQCVLPDITAAKHCGNACAVCCLLLQLNAVQQPTSASNPEGNAFNCTETDLTHVHAAQRSAAQDLNRVWRIKNPAKLHPHRSGAG
jgi:Cu2+-containing amine oxidase